MRLRDILSNKDGEIAEYRQKEFKLKQLLKAQEDWENENKQLRKNL
jgi:hypothetical protein